MMQLTLYVCETDGCAFRGVPYQVREDATTSLPLLEEAADCNGCGERRVRIAESTLSEEP